MIVIDRDSRWLRGSQRPGADAEVQTRIRKQRLGGRLNCIVLSCVRMAKNFCQAPRNLGERPTPFFHERALSSNAPQGESNMRGGG